MKRAAEVEAMAADWILRREAANWSEVDEQSYAQWVAEDRAHHIAVLRLSSVWTKASRLRVTDTKAQMQAIPSAPAPSAAELAPTELASAEPSRANPHGPSAGKRWSWAAALAASLVLLAVPLYQNYPSPDVYTTTVGGFQHVPLKDGSQIDLNTASSITVDYSGKNRRIMLGQGEAYFAVAKDPTRPFIVETKGWRVVAVGTAFTVNEQSGGIAVVVTEGRVRIEPMGSVAAGAAPIYASAGQAVRLASAASGAPAANLLNAAPADLAVGWRDGLLDFEGRPLGEVADQMNRYNHLQMVVDPSAEAVRVDGSFRTTNAAGFIRLLEKGFGVRAIEEDGRVLLIKEK